MTRKQWIAHGYTQMLTYIRRCRPVCSLAAVASSRSRSPPPSLSDLSVMPVAVSSSPAPAVHIIWVLPIGRSHNMTATNSAMPFVQYCEHTYMILFELEGISLLRHEDPVESLLEVVSGWPVHPFGDLHESQLPDASRPVYVRRCNCAGMGWNT